MVHGPPLGVRLIGVARRPVGHATRGKTAPNRLRRVDTFLQCYDPGVLRLRSGGRPALFVDVGYGEDPVTTLESAERFRRQSPSLVVVGVEIDRARVAAAVPLADESTSFRHGGFDLPLGVDATGNAERAALIRAFNVLRQYDPADVMRAWSLMGRHLLPGGLLIEGTSDPNGRAWTANLLRGAPGEADAAWPTAGASLPVVGEGLAFSFNLRSSFDPEVFAPVLPKSLIHRMVPGEPIYDFLSAWRAQVRDVQALATWGARAVFVAAARRLLRAGFRIDGRPRLLRRGYLVWRDGCTCPDSGQR